jgi:hypothetical protein
MLGADPCKGASTGYLEPNTHARACTRDIRNFVLTLPWATVLDPPMYRDTWLEEVEWAGSSSCKQAREIGQKLP